MELQYSKITNFRSVKSVKLEFEPSCRVLVGINESGKTNVLKALSLLSTEINPSKEDIRESLPTEKPISEANVRFVFKLSKEELESIANKISSKVLTATNGKIISEKGKEMTLKEFCVSRMGGLLEVNLLDESKSFKFWAMGEPVKIIGGLAKVKPGTDFAIQGGNESINLKDYILANSGDFIIPEEYLEKLEPQALNNIVGEEIKLFMSENLPRVIYWKYDEDNLLPPKVNLNQFMLNPDACVPLKNMFLLAGYSNIAEAVTEAQKISTNRVRNLLNKVAKATTDYFQDVWKEYKDIEFSLEQNGDDVDITVKEENHFNMTQRSDGFKRFVSFLLLISTITKSNILKDSLLIIDEPDVGLHPSGSKYLRAELLKIAEANLVVYSTHSLFMIDRDCIERHFIVSKKKEVTILSEANESNVLDEEVLFNALGYSAFETLKKKNIIFEGWTDKKLFRVAYSRVPAAYTSIKSVFKDVGLTHAKGVPQVKNISSVLELANRECIIVSDSDEAAIAQQRSYNSNMNYGNWYRYDEITTPVFVTAEDFVKDGAFEKSIAAMKAEKNIATDPVLTDSEGKVAAIKKWLRTSGCQDDEVNDVIKVMKQEVFRGLKQSQIEPSYYDLLLGLSLKI